MDLAFLLSKAQLLLELFRGLPIVCRVRFSCLLACVLAVSGSPSALYMAISALSFMDSTTSNTSVSIWDELSSIRFLGSATMTCPDPSWRRQKSTSSCKKSKRSTIRLSNGTCPSKNRRATFWMTERTLLDCTSISCSASSRVWSVMGTAIF